MKIGIIGAMELEVQLLREKLQDRKDTELFGFTFHEGRIGSHQVVVLLSGIGKVSAAVATALLINQFKPELIINTGTAGGLKDTRVYDIILATEVRHHDVDVTAFISDRQRREWIEKSFSEALAVEMEASAIAQTCHIMGVPFLMLRAISDNAGEGDTVSYESFVEKAGALSAEMNISFIENLK